MGTGLKILLNELDLIDNQGVFFLDKKDGKTFKFPSKEIQKKLAIIKPNAYYVFNNQPYILFFDLTGTSNLDRESEIHKQVWSFDQSPLVFIVKDNDVQIFNAFAYQKNINRLQEIKLKSGQNRKDIFSFWNLQSGATWTWLQEYYYKNVIHKKRVNQKLFENIKLVREVLTQSNIDNKLTDDEANILILRLIFIRYLIDRNVKLDPEFIPGSTVLERKKSLSDLIEKPRKLNEFFSQLNEKFNGVLFKDIKIQLTKPQAQSLALVFSGEKHQAGTLFYGTDFYFEIFDFGIIPVEVISGIYESLIDEETRELHSAVYTPSFVVEYILSNSVDTFFKRKENRNKSECVVFDPSCGSGIFLVQSLRRMIDREIELHNAKINTKKFSERIREIAKKNLFGVDINPQALKVTCFSIYIALLDYQEPKDIDKYEFPSLLNENLFNANFFDKTHSYNEILKTKHLSFILGNPPWKNGSDDPIHMKYLKEEHLLDIVSDFQLAQSFIIHTKDFVQGNPECCLVVTSKTVYNTNADAFRKYFLGKFYLNNCFDLSPVRRLIFEGADNPAMILRFGYAGGKDTLQNIVLHQSLKYNIYLKYYRTFVIEKNDTKKIKQQFFYERDWMFKVALYGSALDYGLLKRVFSDNSNSNLMEYLKASDIIFGDGIKKLTENGKKRLNKPAKPFLEIEDIPIIETSEIKEYFTPVNKENLPTNEDLFVKSGENIKLYKGHRIILKARPRNEVEIVCSYIKEDCVFREKTLGICTAEKFNELKAVFGYIISNVYSYYQFMTSSSLGIYMPEILQKEYLSFPYVELNKRDFEKLVSLVNDFIGPFEKYYSNTPRPSDLPISAEKINKINTIIYSAYQINALEKDLIDYVLNIARYQFQSEEKQKKLINFTYSDMTHSRNRDLVLNQYANIFLESFGEIYEGEYMQVDVYPLKHFIAMNFTFSMEKRKEDIRIVPVSDLSSEKQVFSAIAKTASISRMTQDLYVQKDIKGFEENSFYIIKPNEYKCWHKAMAWYDVIEIKEAIQSIELERLKNN